MPGHVGLLDSTAITARTQRQVEDVARRNVTPERPGSTEVAPFSSPETPTVSESGPYEPHTGGAVVSVVARCRVAGTTASTVDVKHNGTVFATVTIPANALRGVAYPNRRVAANVDYLTAAVTAVGTGVKAISVFVRMRT